MALDLVQERHQAHACLDRLPPEQLSAVRGLLETMLDPMSRALANEAREWLKHNKPIPREEVPAGFGHTVEAFGKMGRTALPPEPNGADR